MRATIAQATTTSTEVVESQLLLLWIRGEANPPRKAIMMTGIAAERNSPSCISPLTVIPPLLRSGFIARPPVCKNTSIISTFKKNIMVGLRNAAFYLRKAGVQHLSTQSHVYQSMRPQKHKE